MIFVMKVLKNSLTDFIIPYSSNDENDIEISSYTDDLEAKQNFLII